MRDPRNWVRPAAAVRHRRGRRHRAGRAAGAHPPPRPQAAVGQPARAGRAHASGLRRGSAPGPPGPLSRRAAAGDRSAAAPGRPGPLIPSAAHGHLLSPPLARDRRLVLLLRAADLPRLHDADLGGHALPGVRARAHQGQDGAQRGPTAPVVTQALIAINVLVFFGETATGTPLGGVGASGFGTLYRARAHCSGPYIDQVHHQYYRLVTAGFLHDGLLHIAFNMFFLYFLGPMLEPAIGRLNFAVVYFVSLLAGSFGALLFSAADPHRGRLGRLLRAPRRADRRRPLPGDLDLAERPRAHPADQHRVLAQRERHLDRRPSGGLRRRGHLRLADRASWASGAACPPPPSPGAWWWRVVSVIAAIAVAGGAGLAPNGITI